MPTNPTCTPTGNQIKISTTLASAKAFNSISVTIGGFTNPKIIDYADYFTFKIMDSTTVVAKTPDTTYKVTLDKAKLNRKFAVFLLVLN